MTQLTWTLLLFFCVFGGPIIVVLINEVLKARERRP